MPHNNFLIVFFILFIITSTFPNSLKSDDKEIILTFPISMTVLVPVLNVRAIPIEHNGKHEFDPHQETQLEMNDPVIVFEVKDKWARVECPLQKEFTHNNFWQGYPGWVMFDGLSTTTASQSILQKPSVADEFLRKTIISKAFSHMGNAYLWGGRSLFSPDNNSTVTGVDCSGLINWAYKEVGLQIPRDAHEQYMLCRKINPLMMASADLIFLANKENPKKIVHVLMYAGGDDIIEAPQTGEKVRRMSIKNRFGRNLSQLSNGSIIEDRVLFFGSFFREQQ